MSWYGSVRGRGRIPPQSSGGGGGGIVFAANLPGGLTTLVDRQWNPTDATIPGGVLPPSPLANADSYGMTWVVGDGNIPPIIATPVSLTSTIGATIPAVPDGNATVMAIKYPSGFPAGTVPFAVFKTTVPTRLKMYLCCWVLMPTNFDSNGNNIKWLGIESDGDANHIFMLCSGANTDYRAAWMVTQGGAGNGQYGGESNSAGAIISLPYPPQHTGLGWWNSNIGAWHCLEWYAQQETVPGTSADGVFKGWFDGTLINSWANINFNKVSGNPNGFQTCSFIPYYGGGGSAATADRYLCIGRFLAASGN